MEEEGSSSPSILIQWHKQRKASDLKISSQTTQSLQVLTHLAKSSTKQTSFIKSILHIADTIQ